MLHRRVRAIFFLLVWAKALGTQNVTHIVQVVADDLGYNDLGFMNGGKTVTPNIDSLRREGILLTDYYTFRVCAPSRASSMTGRYPFNVGFYDMSHDKHHCVDPSFKMLPELLRAGGYRTYITGKWDVGFIKQHCTPTFRGFETFLGYYSACTSDYWYHGAPGGNATEDKCGGIDLHDSTTDCVKGASMSGPHSYNGTYDQDLFTDRAVSTIQSHDISEPLYLYVAYHNVHDACTEDRFALGLQAPLETVDQYARTRLDTWKVQGAMTTELDYGVGNITAALKSKGLWENTVFIFMSDNGGPLDHSSNWPLRAGKGHHWEGGYRVVSFVSGGILPHGRHGTNFSGMVHAADWWSTLVSGVAGLEVPKSTGLVPPDSLNVWPALLGTNTTSPRTEVVHAVTNKYFNRSLGNIGVQAARFGNYKLITGLSCDETKVWQAWPELSAVDVPFGLSHGVVEAGTDHARAALLDHGEKFNAGSAATREESDVADQHVCLYDLSKDLGERHNLATDPQYANLIEDLKERLRKIADAGPNISIAYGGVGPINKSADNSVCYQEEATGYLEPLDWHRMCV